MCSFISRLRRGASEESAFTLIELVIVLVILGILLVIAVPSYVGFHERARRGLAEGNVRAAIPAVEAFYADHATYSFMDEEALRLIDAGIKVTVLSAAGPSYCISNTQGNVTYYKNGPGGDISSEECI